MIKTITSLINFDTFLSKAMKRLDETNSMVHRKNNWRVEKVPQFSTETCQNNPNIVFIDKLNRLYFQTILLHWKKEVLTPHLSKKFKKSCQISQHGYLNKFLDELNMFFILNIPLRSFRTHIRSIIRKRYLLLKNIPYLSTERPLIDFKYQETYSARQNDLFQFSYYYFLRKQQ